MGREKEMIPKRMKNSYDTRTTEVLIAILALTSSLMVVSLFFRCETPREVASGAAVGTGQFCFNRPPSLNTLDCATAILTETIYSCTVTASDTDANVTFQFSDTTSRFNINSSSGLIRFTPSSINDSSTETYTISVSDGSGCQGENVSTDLSILYVVASCRDKAQNNNETGVDCGGFCAACSSTTPTGGGGVTNTYEAESNLVLPSDVIIEERTSVVPPFENALVVKVKKGVLLRLIIPTLPLAVQEHRLKVLAVLEDSAIMSIQSEPYLFVVRVNEKHNIDLDGDAINDLRVFLSEVHEQEQFVELSIGTLERPVPPSTKTNYTTQIKSEPFPILQAPSFVSSRTCRIFELAIRACASLLVLAAIVVFTLRMKKK